MTKKEHKYRNKKVHKKETKTIAISAEELASLKHKAQEANEHYDRLLRLQAEFENTKKRLEKEKQEFIKFANDQIISRLLGILDNFKRAVDNSHESHSVADVLKGVRLIDKQFEDVLKEFGLTPIEAIGKKFDPHYHEAVLHEETNEHEDGVVIEELAKGYLLNGRLLRPAVVKVAKKIQG